MLKMKLTRWKLVEARNQFQAKKVKMDKKM